MTVAELQNLLQREEDGDRNIHVVFHGRKMPSFNFRATDARTGANHDDFLIIVEEPV